MDAELRQLAAFHVAVLSKCVIPLFGVDLNSEFRLCGSATLVQIGNGSAFLFTAGHVMDGLGERTAMYGWPTGASPVKIVGEGFTSEPRHPARSADRLDIAFIEITGEIARGLASGGAMMFDASEMRCDANDGFYGVVGYPLTANKPTWEKTEQHRRVRVVFADPRIVYASGVDDATYERVGRSRFTNLLLRRHPPANDPQRGMKSPKGMSGGAMFYLGSGSEIAAGQPRLHLAGIVTEYDEKRRLLIGANARPMADIFKRAKVRSTIDGRLGTVVWRTA